MNRTVVLLGAVMLAVPAWGQGSPVDEERTILEEVVARVNNRIITRTHLIQANQSLRTDLGARFSGQQLEEAYVRERDDTLRGLIDVQLLVQRGDDRGYSVQSEVIQYLDRMRLDMGLNSMEELERAMLSEGISPEEYRARLRDQFMYNMVIQRDVARSVFLNDEAVEAYYEEHKEELVQPESIKLREILISSGTRSREEAAERAREVLLRIRGGVEFTELAQEYSDSSTAERGGLLGEFDPATLSKEVADLAAGLREGGVADPQLTPEGYLILQLVERTTAGVPPLEKVRPEIMNRMYQEKMQPAYREFLNERRRENFVFVKIGYTDTGAVPEDEKPILRGRKRRKARSTRN